MKWGTRFHDLCILNSNNYRKIFPGQQAWSSNDLIVAAGSVGRFIPGNKDVMSSLEKFINVNDDWLFGHLSYDLKNQIENLTSGHPDHINFPSTSFFIPEYIFIIKGNILKLGWHTNLTSEALIKDLLKEIGMQSPLFHGSVTGAGKVEEAITKLQYLDAVKKIKKHIQRGDIYEVNFCQEFYSSNAVIDPLTVWIRLIEESPTPFSCYYRLHDKYLLCASPERFIRKKGNKIISQPIKGTSARGKTDEEDMRSVDILVNDPKERAENIMITDLVRNDLSKIAMRASVRVEELCTIYPYPGVNQMQSGISALMPADISFTDIVKAMFPMGSMTGAPKIRAMEIIEHYERSKRGLYSGSVGFISPQKDFDFNVVIRSIQYNKASSWLSFMAGGAITSLSVPEYEYRESILKAGAILKVLQHKIPAT